MGEETNKEEAKSVEAAPEQEKVKKGEEEKVEKKQENPPPPPPPFILHVDLHCVGCAKKIERSLMKIRGVEGVIIDMSKNQVTIKGVVEPQAVCGKIMKKTKRQAKVLSPPPPAEGEAAPQLVSSQVEGLVTIELNVKMHCEACANQLKTKILKMRGVQTATTEVASGKVVVTGTMDANKLVEYVYRRTRKQAQIVPKPEPEAAPEEKKEDEKPAEAEAKPEENKKDEGGEENKAQGEKTSSAEEETKKEENESQLDSSPTLKIEDEEMKRMVYYYQPLYVIERIPPPQLFSDENPNACCIM